MIVKLTRLEFALIMTFAFNARPLCASQGDTLKVGDSFPELSNFPLEGQVPKTLKGKVVVVDFWASWCGPCRKSFPLMEELHQRFSSQGLVILAINEDKSRSAMTRFLEEQPVAFTVIRDSKKKLAAAVNVPGLPTTYILDAEGKVFAIHPDEKLVNDRKAYFKQIKELLKRNSSQKP